MNPPRINNDDRGLTINKAAALVGLLVSVVGLLAATLTISNAFRDVQNEVKGFREQAAAQAEDRRTYRADMDARVRTLELSRAGDQRDLANALSLLTRIDARLERIEQQTYRSTPRSTP